MSAVRRWNIAAGNFFFRYRNALFPIVFAAVVPFLRPHVIVDPEVDRALIGCGVLIAWLGEALRLTTIGFEYIERGGKNKQVYASRLVQGGVYSLTRNPMYVGNLLITLGVSMAAGSYWIYLLIVPFFLFVYASIIMAEEAYLRGRFGSDYEAYCAQVSRFLPSMRRWRSAFDGLRYNWRKAIRQDMSTITGLLVGLDLIALWRTYYLRGWDAAVAQAPLTAAWLAVILAGFAWLHTLKKRGVFSPKPESVAARSAA